MSNNDIYFDQYDYEIDENPYPIMQRMRDEAPVWYNEKYDYWAISRYEDVLKASRDTATFSSSYKTVLELMTDEPHQSSMIINTDPPYHKMLRDIVAPFFTPAKVAQLEDDIRKIVVSYLKPLEGKTEFDFVEDFARWIPMDVVSTILGVPEEDRRQINIWGNELLHRDEGQTEPGEMNIAASEGLDNYFAKFMLEFRNHPNNTVSSAIVNNIVNDNGVDRPLTDAECIDYFHLIGAAGNETVARLLGSAAWLLGAHPKQRKLLAEDPKRLPHAVEELLRFEAPSPTQFRRTLKDIELHGQLIPAGSNVC
ncbi:MAG: cytochrome P450, partial [Pseudomonadales bacterium]